MVKQFVYSAESDGPVEPWMQEQFKTDGRELEGFTPASNERVLGAVYQSQGGKVFACGVTERALYLVSTNKESFGPYAHQTLVIPFGDLVWFDPFPDWRGQLKKHPVRTWGQGLSLAISVSLLFMPSSTSTIFPGIKINFLLSASYFLGGCTYFLGALWQNLKFVLDRGEEEPEEIRWPVPYRFSPFWNSALKKNLKTMYRWMHEAQDPVNHPLAMQEGS